MRPRTRALSRSSPGSPLLSRISVRITASSGRCGAPTACFASARLMQARSAFTDSHKAINMRRILITLVTAALAVITQAAAAPPENVNFARVTIPRLAKPPAMADFEGMEALSDVARQMLRIEHFTGRLPVDDVPSSE